MIEIIAISEAHIESFHRALDTVARERRYLAFLEAPPLESTCRFVLGMIAQGQPQFVVLSGGEVVGWCDVTRQSGPIHAHVGTLGMGLLQPFRGQGIGTQLIRRTLAAAQATGLSRIELSVYENNAGAIALYKKVGFAVEGVSRNAARVNGVYENVVQMALLF
ncbi:GNAT family protein [Bradyrhizobium sp. BR 10289]|uniref:GNAT family N-acetyltransferase n=1 Tax=Bradyrhizobium sp. BR 10289 TaxID=2749993 RepID=UPI001C65316D|nr:GNAT family protein [Bradyrhizobium sp. BR 10289]MBW7975003.1 GNAT family N-acetyltransferase [Bradyrhizobium sp. BR 10289]